MTELGIGPEALPVPPLRLRRVHLHGVGPAGARFDPLHLDFTTRDGAAARVLLSLTNTGGKSTLITLLTSLIVPAARAQVGRKNLGDYVLDGDTAHVVCEWEDASTDTRTVIGTVMEWKDGRRQPAHNNRSPTNMHRAWYMFRRRSGDEFGIGRLPFLTDGRRTRLTEFVKAVESLLEPEPERQWVVLSTTRNDTQQNWTTALVERTSVDPVLFGYQMRMNDSESGAQKLLESFSSPDQVVRFLLTALNDDQDITSFTNSLGEYAKVAANRPGLEARATFGAQVQPGLERVVERAGTAKAAEASVGRAKLTGGEFTTSLRNRVGQDEDSLVELSQAVEQADRALINANREYGRISDIRLQLQWMRATNQRAIARADLDDCDEAAERADLEAQAWAAVDLILDLERARAERKAAQAAYDGAELGLTPLRTAARDAAAALAARIDGLLVEIMAEMDELHAREASARAEHDSATEDERTARDSVTKAVGELTWIDERVAEATESMASARGAGWLNAGEEPAACLERWQADRTSARSESMDAAETARCAKGAGDRVDEQVEGADQQLIELRAEAQRHRQLLGDHDSELMELAGDLVLTELLGAAPRDADDLHRTAELADTEAIDADRRAEAHGLAAEQAREELAYLDTTGTAPAGPDTLAVLDAVRASAHAVTGLEWIGQNLPNAEARSSYIEGDPELAGGVVVLDPERFGEAEVALRAAERLRTRTPVTVTVAPGGTVASPPDGATEERRHVVLPHRATWDKEWAAGTRAEQERIAVDEAERATRARGAATGYRRVSAVCTAFVNRWRESPRGVLAELAGDAERRVIDAEQARERLVRERAGHRRAAAQAWERAEAAGQRATKAAECVAKVEGLCSLVTSSAEVASRREAVEARRWAALAEAEQARSRVISAQDTANAAMRAAADLRASRGPLERERAALGIDRAGADLGGNVEVLRAEWHSLCDELRTSEQGMREAEFLRRAVDTLAKEEAKRQRHTEEALELAARLATTPAATSHETRRGAQERARDARDRAVGDRNKARLEWERADKEARMLAPPSDRQNHADLTRTPEWSPARPEDIPNLLERLEQHNEELKERAARAESEAREARELHESVTIDIASFMDTIGMWASDEMPTTRAFAGKKKDARDEMRELVETFHTAERLALDEQAALRDSAAAVREVANDGRWKDFRFPSLLRVQALREHELVAEAASLARRIGAEAASAAGDLRKMNENREVLRNDLLMLCRTQRRLLREVSKASRLPAGLRNLSERPALKILFHDAPDDEAAGRLASRVDSWAVDLARNPKLAGSTEVRFRWLADAVRDTVVNRVQAGPWSIEVLKPSIDGQVSYCPPERFTGESSGGQALTLAVLVYCALSRVRAARRPGGARPPGTLILDNPFGAASNETLIEMQHRLAAHAGLQLICATGLHDAGVDAAFTGSGSVIVKLRNDGDQRRGLSFLRLRESVVDGLSLTEAITGGRDPGAKTNWLGSARYEVR